MKSRLLGWTVLDTLIIVVGLFNIFINGLLLYTTLTLSRPTHLFTLQNLPFNIILLTFAISIIASIGCIFLKSWARITILWASRFTYSYYLILGIVAILIVVFSTYEQYFSPYLMWPWGAIAFTSGMLWLGAQLFLIYLIPFFISLFNIVFFTRLAIIKHL